jgi:K+-transporting ATPase ATPase C chain
MLRRQLLSAALMVLTMTALVGLAYPLTMTGVAQVAFKDKANGSLVTRDGRAVGSGLIGQTFTGAQYFHPRPSAAGDGYDPEASSASNLGPTNEALVAEVRERVQAYRETNGLAPDAAVPADAVTASASGLDPAISIDNARLQANRVATERHLPPDTVRQLVDEHTSARQLGVLGEPTVNVLELNLALDRAGH